MPRPDLQPLLATVDDNTELYTQQGSGLVRRVLFSQIKAYLDLTTGQTYEVADMTALAALTGIVDGSVAYITDIGNGQPGISAYTSSTWQTPTSRGSSVKLVADVVARDALTGMVSGDSVEIADTGSGLSRSTWNGTSWSTPIFSVTAAGSTIASSTIAATATLTLAQISGEVIYATATGGDTVLTLPIASSWADTWCYIKCVAVDATSAVVITANAADTIDGLATMNLNTLNQVVKLHSNGATEVYVIADA